MKYTKDIEKLEFFSNEARKDIIKMIYKAKSGHPGGSLSCIDILVCLYHSVMDITLDDNLKRKDKFILSKGHAAPAYYAILSQMGFIPRKDLVTLRKYNSYLEGHPSNKIFGVDVSSGSLGQGVSIANGMAMAKKISKDDGYVYVLVGDGEIEEGQVWEAFMTTSKYNLNNMILIIDKNNLQIDGSVEQVKNIKVIDEKLNAFGFNVINANGHDFKDLSIAFKEAKMSTKPSCIIAHTIKGKGISFMENMVSWHGKSLNDEEYEKAMKELGGAI